MTKCTDKKNCRVYKGSDDEDSQSFLSHLSMTFNDSEIAHRCRIVDVVDVRYYDDLDTLIDEEDWTDGDGPRRFGKTVDTGKTVELFEGAEEGDWYAIEVEDEDGEE